MTIFFDVFGKNPFLKRDVPSEIKDQLPDEAQPQVYTKPPSVTAAEW